MRGLSLFILICTLWTYLTSCVSSNSYKELEDQLKSTERLLNESQGRNSTLELRLDTYSKDLTSKGENLSNLSSQLMDLKSQLISRDSEITRLQKIVNSNSQELEALSKKLEINLNKYDFLITQKAQLQAELIRQEGLVVSLQSSIESSKASGIPLSKSYTPNIKEYKTLGEGVELFLDSNLTKIWDMSTPLDLGNYLGVPSSQDKWIDYNIKVYIKNLNPETITISASSTDRPGLYRIGIHISSDSILIPSGVTKSLLVKISLGDFFGAPKQGEMQYVYWNIQ